MVKRRASRSRSAPRKRRRTSSRFIRGRGDYVPMNLPIRQKVPSPVSNVGNPAPWNPLTWTSDLRETSAKAMPTTVAKPAEYGFWEGMLKYALPVAFAGLTGAGVAGSLLDLGAASAGMTAQRAAWTARNIASTEADLVASRAASTSSRSISLAEDSRAALLEKLAPTRPYDPYGYQRVDIGHTMPGSLIRAPRMRYPTQFTAAPVRSTARNLELQRIRDMYSK